MRIDDELLDRALDGEASQAELEELQVWLREQANLEAFVLRAELHADLRRSLRRRRLQQDLLPTETHEPASPSKQQTNTLGKLRSKRPLTLTAIGLVTAACLLIAILWPNPEFDAARDNYVASIVSDVSGVLTKDEQPWDEVQITSGHYELQQGLLSLEFGGGVMVYVEAPARFDATGDDRVVLHSGRLSARVPPEGVGFTVETPEAEIVDFGTEFSVDVASGASEVHVFDGLVRVHPGSIDQRETVPALDVEASQAVRISDGVAPEDISLATERFIRNFDEPKLNYARFVKRLSPVAYYRMPIRDRGLIAEPPKHSGVVLTGAGKRPPHARGVFVGGSLRVGADSSGRGGRVDSPPSFQQDHFSLAVFVYREAPARDDVIVTNLSEHSGTFGLFLDRDLRLRAKIMSKSGDTCLVEGRSILSPQTWRHVVFTADGEQLCLYEDGDLVASAACKGIAASIDDSIWFGTNASGGQIWDGRIDEVAFFDRALDAREIADLYRIAQEEIANNH